MKLKFWDKLQWRNDSNIDTECSPVSLSFNETYYFNITLANISDNQASDEPPVGKVSIRTPYDIWRDEEKFSGSLKKVINLDHYHKTNLDSIPEIWNDDKKFTLEKVPTLAKQRFSYQQDKTLYNLPRIPSFKYQPDKLTFSPISIKVKLFDEVEISDIRETFSVIANLENEKGDISSEIVNHISEQSGFENRLLFNVSISLKLPKSLRITQDNVGIRSIALKWPLATSPRHLGLSIIEAEESNTSDRKHDYHNKNVIYDPKKEEIKWSNLPLFKVKKDENTLDHIEYRSWLMQLSLREPGEFYNQRVLRGTIDISIPTLLSGLEVNTTHMHVETSSNLIVNLDIYVDELFTNRYFAPYQNLHFPNLILNDMRLADILLMLKDMRFQNVRWRAIEDPKEKRTYFSQNNPSPKIERMKKLITAERQEGSGKLQLAILLEGFTTTTTREKAIVGDEKFITGFPAGSTIVYIRGLIKGDNNRVIEVISEIHDRLKERFRHVSAVK